MLSRRARREAAEQAAELDRPDPRIETIERVLAGFQTAANAFVLGLSVIGWLWLAAQQPATGSAARGDAAAGAAPGQVTAGTAGAAGSAPDGLAANPLLEPLATASGATLVLVMLATCLLMAPVVNPFYAPPPERRLLHTATTVLFGVLAVTTVAVISGAAR